MFIPESMKSSLVLLDPLPSRQKDNRKHPLTVKRRDDYSNSNRPRKELWTPESNIKSSSERGSHYTSSQNGKITIAKKFTPNTEERKDVSQNKIKILSRVSPSVTQTSASNDTNNADT